MPLFEQLKDKYADRDVEILHIYVREPHPEETIFKAYKKHETYEQKMAYARELVDLKKITADVLVDGIDEAAHHLLGELPNMVYVVNKDGNIHYKATWSDVDRIDKVLAELVTADDPSNPVVPTFSTQKVGMKI